MQLPSANFNLAFFNCVGGGTLSFILKKKNQILNEKDMDALKKKINK